MSDLCEMPDLYLWMVRPRPKRKGDKPGPWRHNKYKSPVNKDELHTLKMYVEKWNKRDKNEEHAVFIIPGGRDGRLDETIPAEAPLFENAVNPSPVARCPLPVARSEAT